jgi:hypothetical protein
MEPTISFRLQQDGGQPYRLTVPPGVSVITPVPPPRSSAIIAIGAVAALVLMGAVRQMGRSGSTARAGALTEEEREGLPAKDFAVPDERKYPIHDLRHGQLALTYVMAPSNMRYRYRVMSRVFPRYPSLINWWAGTEKGLEMPLTEQLFRSKILEYRRQLSRAPEADRTWLEDELASLQLLVSMVPRLKQLATKAATKVAR